MSCRECSRAGMYTYIYLWMDVFSVTGTIRNAQVAIECCVPKFLPTGRVEFDYLIPHFPRSFRWIVSGGGFSGVLRHMHAHSSRAAILFFVFLFKVYIHTRGYVKKKAKNKPKAMRACTSTYGLKKYSGALSIFGLEKIWIVF